MWPLLFEGRTVGVCSRTVLSAKEVESQEEVEFSSVCQVLTPRSSEIKSENWQDFTIWRSLPEHSPRNGGEEAYCVFLISGRIVLSPGNSCFSLREWLLVYQYSLSFGCSLGSKPALDSLFLFVIKAGLSHRVSDLSSVYLFWKLSFISPQMR